MHTSNLSRMTPRINMIGIITSNFDTMLAFYRDTLGFDITLQMDEFAEFKSDGVRLALSTTQVMAHATGEESYTEKKAGHAFELAFDAGSPAAVDTDFATLVAKGATAIKEPSDMPWGQRTAFFADPDGNIHEIFANL